MDNRRVIVAPPPSPKVNSKTPIVFSIVMHALFMLIAVLVVVLNFKKVMNLDVFQRIIILLVFAGMVGFHGLLHTAMGMVYGENLITIPHLMTIPI